MEAGKNHGIIKEKDEGQKRCSKAGDLHMKIAVFVTGWNKEYLRYLYGGLVNAQNKFGDEIDIYTCYAKLGSGNSVDKSEFSFFKLANLKEYDGIIFPSTTVKEGDIKNKMIEWILDTG